MGGRCLPFPGSLHGRRATEASVRAGVCHHGVPAASRPGQWGSGAALAGPLYPAAPQGAGEEEGTAYPGAQAPTPVLPQQPPGEARFLTNTRCVKPESLCAHGCPYTPNLLYSQAAPQNWSGKKNLVSRYMGVCWVLCTLRYSIQTTKETTGVVTKPHSLY